MPQAEWDMIAQAMQREFRQGDFWRGSLAGIERIAMISAIHFPSGANNYNELSNKPVIVKRWKQIYFVCIGFLTMTWPTRICNE